MYICAIANQKGGVGKTTTAHNLGVQLARNAKKRVLLLDLDAQGNLSDACGLDPQTLEYTVFDVLAGNASIAEAKSTLEAGLDILPANIRLAEAELAFAGRIGRENLLKKALLSVSGEYDYVLIDCPAFSRTFDRQRPQCGKRIAHPCTGRVLRSGGAGAHQADCGTCPRSQS